MNLIDAIEGSSKSIIQNLHRVFLDDNLDDAEFIRNVKAVLQGASEFVQSNSELLHDPKIVQKVLYQYAKELWIADLKEKIQKEDQAEEDSRKTVWEHPESDEYYEYYFDYIYAHSIYPK